MKSIDKAFYGTNEEPCNYYIRDINLELQIARPALVLREISKNGRLRILYLDNLTLGTLAPRGRYGVKEGIDLAGTPEMTRRKSIDFLEEHAEILVVSPTGGDGRKTLERWVTVDDYEDSLPRRSDQL